MKQVEKFAKEESEDFFDSINAEDKWNDDERSLGNQSYLTGYKKGFQKALDCVTLYLHYKHRLGTLNEFNINFEDIQRIADTEIDENE